MNAPRGTMIEIQIDCFKLLCDLHQHGVNNSEAARRLGVDRNIVKRWKEGQEPKYSEAVRLMNLHAYVCQIRAPESKTLRTCEV